MDFPKLSALHEKMGQDTCPIYLSLLVVTTIISIFILLFIYCCRYEKPTKIEIYV